MPVFNGEDFLEHAVRSILNQSFSDFDFIIVNDGSTDRTRSLIDAFSLSDDRIKPIHLPDTQGVGRARQIALEASSATLVAIMDSDDVAHPDRLVCQVRHLKTHQNVDILATQVRQINRDGKVVGLPRYPTRNRAVANLMPLVTAIPNPTVMMRREAILRIGGYRPFGAAEDRDLWLRALREGLSVRALRYRLLDYRVFATADDDKRRRYAEWSLFADVINDVGFPNLGTTPLGQSQIHRDALDYAISRSASPAVSGALLRLRSSSSRIQDEAQDWLSDIPYNENRSSTQFLQLCFRLSLSLASAGRWNSAMRHLVLALRANPVATSLELWRRITNRFFLKQIALLEFLASLNDEERQL